MAMVMEATGMAEAVTAAMAVAGSVPERSSAEPSLVLASAPFLLPPMLLRRRLSMPRRRSTTRRHTLTHRIATLRRHHRFTTLRTDA